MSHEESWALEDGIVKEGSFSVDRGVGVRAISGERTGWQAWTAGQAQQGRERYDSRQRRLAREKDAHAVRLEARAAEKLADLPAHSKITDGAVLDKKRAVIEAALARSRERRGQAAD